MNALIALALIWPGGQDPNPNITFETPAKFAEAALAELSKSAGVNLMVSSQTKEEILIIRVKDVPLNEVLAKIAQATNAEWQKEPSGYRLIRSAKLLQEQERKHNELDAAKIASSQKKLQASLMEQGEMTPNMAQTLGIRIEAVVKEAKERKGRETNYDAQQQLGRALPGGRLATSLALLLDPKVLATMDDPGKVVFSTAPNRMQKPMPRGAQALIERYVRERETMKPHLPQVDATNIQGLTSDMWNIVNRGKTKDDRPAKVLAEARTWEFASNMMVTVYVANAAGKILDTSNCSLPMQEMMGPPPTPPGVDPTGDKPLELTIPSKELMEAFKVAMARGGGGDDFPELPDSVKPYVLEPEKHTLAELACSDLFLGISKAKGLNVVAAPTDVFGFYSGVLFAAGAPTPSQFLQRMRAPIFDMKLEEPPGWLILRMEDPWGARRFRMDRFALGKLIRGAIANGKVSIDDMAVFAASTAEDFERMSCLLYFMMASPKIGRDFERSPWQMLRFYGGLSSNQRQALAAGEKISYSRLRPDQQAGFDKLIFGNQDNMGHVRRNQVRVPVPVEEGDDSETLEWQPTERFPNGLGPGSTVSVAVTSGPIVRAKGLYQGQHLMKSDMTVESLASYLLAKESSEANWSHETVYNEFSYSDQRKLEFAFDADPEFGVTGEIQETKEMSKTVSSPDQLPAEVWAKVKQLMTQMREAQKNRKPPPKRSMLH